MSTVKIEESFELDAPAEQAWSYLIKPERIVVCLPGAQLTEVLDERNYVGTIKVKVGAVSMTYEGQIEFTIDFPAGATIVYVGTVQDPGASSIRVIAGTWTQQSAGVFGEDTGTWRAPGTAVGS